MTLAAITLKKANDSKTGGSNNSLKCILFRLMAQTHVSDSGLIDMSQNHFD